MLHACSCRFQEIYKYGIHGPFLVIVPLSTIGNWQREFELWSDMNVVIYHGAMSSRNMIQQFDMYYKDEKVLQILVCQCVTSCVMHRFWYGATSVRVHTSCQRCCKSAV